MSRRKELYQKRADLTKEAQAILDRAAEEKREPTAEEAARFDAIKIELGAVDAGIEREEFLIEQQKKLGNPDAVREATIQVGADLAAAKPWGEKSNGFGEFAAAVRNFFTGEGRDTRLFAAASGSNIAIPSEGGFLLPPEFSQRIWDGLMQDQDNLLGMTDNYTVTGDSITFNANAETSRVVGSLYGGVRAYWMAEADQYTATKPKWRQVTVKPHKLGAFAYATDEVMRAPIALGQYLDRAMSAAIRQLVNQSILSGTGAGQPLGLLNSGCVVSVAKETNQAAATINQINLSKMWARLHPAARGGAVWLHNVDIEPQLDALSTVVKNVASTENVGGYANRVFDPERRTLKGRPLVATEWCETLGTKGDIILANLGYYITGTRGGLNSAMSIHLRFDYGETAFRFTFEVDGQSWLASAITPAKGTNTLSTFITLDTRA